MSRFIQCVLLVPIVAMAAGSLNLAQSEDHLDAWTNRVRIAPVSGVEGRHTIHTYYLANPESPEGKRVLFFASIHRAGYVGDLVVLERETGRETVLASNVHAEDAHRAACQQWLSGGRLVAYHEVNDNQWQVVVVNAETRERTVVAEDRQVGFGRADRDLLPMYGCHWNPGPHRGLEIYNAATGELSQPVGITDVEAKYDRWLDKTFGGRPTSIFFPVLSPNGKRVFFKMSAGKGGDNYMARDASYRQGLVCYDLEESAFVWLQAKWGHPSWHPDSRHIFNTGNLLFDTNTCKYTRIPDLPKLRGSHPSLSPDGRLMVTDGVADAVGAKEKEWGILVGDMRDGKWVLLHSFSQSQGAKSWRRSDPHPVFSADGRRIYYNVSDGPFTRLFVAERR